MKRDPDTEQYITLILSQKKLCSVIIRTYMAINAIHILHLGVVEWGWRGGDYANRRQELLRCVSREHSPLLTEPTTYMMVFHH